MAPDPSSDVTTLLAAIRAGDAQARHQLVERVYAELHGLARGLMQKEPNAASLQATGLLHEALLRLLPGQALDRLADRPALFGAAAQAMRRVLADHARNRKAQKRGGDWQRLPFDSLSDYCADHQVDLIALHD